MKQPQLYVIGGPNGAGKTTASLLLLPKFLDVFEFVNADAIAAGLNPIRPESANITAGRLMLDRINELTEAKKDFAFETTLAGRYHLQTIKTCRANGYAVNLLFLWLPDADMAVQRVKYRVAQGGHNIPENIIRRRYKAGLRNLVNDYLPAADTAFVFNGAEILADVGASVIVKKTPEKPPEILLAAEWQEILIAAREE